MLPEPSVEQLGSWRPGTPSGVQSAEHRGLERCRPIHMRWSPCDTPYSTRCRGRGRTGVKMSTTAPGLRRGLGIVSVYSSRPPERAVLLLECCDTVAKVIRCRSTKGARSSTKRRGADARRRAVPVNPEQSAARAASCCFGCCDTVARLKDSISDQGPPRGADRVSDAGVSISNSKCYPHSSTGRAREGWPPQRRRTCRYECCDAVGKLPARDWRPSHESASDPAVLRGAQSGPGVRRGALRGSCRAAVGVSASMVSTD